MGDPKLPLRRLTGKLEDTPSEVEVWWELASLITIVLLGHWLEMRAISQARGALNALAVLLPDTAERVTGSETETVPLFAIRATDVVLVRPGTVSRRTAQHTYSTLLHANGEDPKVVPEPLRHSSTKGTMDIYIRSPSPLPSAGLSRE